VPDVDVPDVDAPGTGDEPGAVGPGGSLDGGRARRGYPCRIEAWRANIHEPTDHQGASAQVQDPGVKISRRDPG
jgi:hypothetical protein